jgi:hypothetical protein
LHLHAITTIRYLLHAQCFKHDYWLQVRTIIMRYFNADPAEWQLVFTRSATGALKLVGETFPWTSGSLFRYDRGQGTERNEKEEEIAKSLFRGIGTHNWSQV